MEILRRMRGVIASRLDGYVDDSSGVGGRGKGVSATYQPSAILTEEDCGNLYRSNWLAQRIVEQTHRYALGAGFTTDPPEALTEFVRLTHTNAYPEGLYLSACFEGSLYGGAGLIMGAPGDMASAIDPAKPPPVAWFSIVNKFQLEEKALEENKDLPNFGEPILFKIKGSHPRKDLEFHPSRAIWFNGAHAVGDRRAENLNFFSESVLQAVSEELQRFGLTWAAASHMIQEAAIPVFKMKGFRQALSQSGVGEIEARLSLMATAKSILGALFLEEGEEFTRDQLTMTGVPDMIALAKDNISAAADTPQTILFGTSPGGLNATGESDMTTFRRKCEAKRNLQHKPALERLLKAIKKPAVVTFPPLDTPTAAEGETIRLNRAQGDAVYINTGGVDAIDVLLARQAEGTLGFTLPSEAIARMRASLAEDNTNTGVNPTELVTPTTRAAIITVNQMLKLLGLPPTTDGTGEMKIAELEALQKATADAEAKRLAGELNGPTQEPTAQPTNQLPAITPGNAE